ncbi:MAG: hypothetical protein U0236_05630 [Nitrospira sp.]
MEHISYHRLASRELNEAAQYYESESPGLGAAFLDEVERGTQAIAKLSRPPVRRRFLRDSGADFERNPSHRRLMT